MGIPGVLFAAEGHLRARGGLVPAAVFEQYLQIRAAFPRARRACASRPPTPPIRPGQVPSPRAMDGPAVLSGPPLSIFPVLLRLKRGTGLRDGKGIPGRLKSCLLRFVPFSWNRRYSRPVLVALSNWGFFWRFRRSRRSSRHLLRQEEEKWAGR